jgi:NADH:ubiquinone oxidoreductase subunit 2 (subunit N)
LLIAGTAISLYAYFKVVRMMYDPHDQPAAATVRTAAPLAYAGIALCAIFVLAMTFYPLTPSNVLPLAR